MDDVACDDGKLSLLGVPTPTAIAGWSGAAPPDDALDHDRRGVRDEGADPGDHVLAAAAGLQHRAQRGGAHPAEGVLAEVAEAAGRGQHARAVGQLRLHGDQHGLLGRQLEGGPAHRCSPAVSDFPASSACSACAAASGSKIFDQASRLVRSVYAAR